MPERAVGTRWAMFCSVHKDGTATRTTLKHCWRPCTPFDGSDSPLLLSSLTAGLITLILKKTKVQEWFKEKNNACVRLTWLSNPPYLCLIKPLWDVLDYLSGGPRFQSLASPYLDVSGVFWQQMASQRLFDLRVLFLCLPLLQSIILSFLFFLYMVEDKRTICHKNKINPANNKKRTFWWRKKNGRWRRKGYII